MSAKKQKLRDSTNLTPEDAKSTFAIAGSSVSNNYASSLDVADDLAKSENDLAVRSLEQHFLATVQAVLHSLRESHLQPVPWSLVAVSVA
jgi:hypothetical protein